MGFEKARKKTWPRARVQRCTFHAFGHIEATYGWCCMHTEHPLPAAQILEVMPADADIDAAYRRLHDGLNDPLVKRWAEAITWNDLHHASHHRNAWDCSKPAPRYHLQPLALAHRRRIVSA